MNELERIRRILSNVICMPFGVPLTISAEHDRAKKPAEGEPRVFVQVSYDARDSRTGEPCHWKGRKWYLSEHMTHDEVVKTAWAAVELTVKHELMESFLWQGERLFNPHAGLEGVLEAGRTEDKRETR
jgi:hypothetical protein